jgi:hypothetical protein
MGHGPLMVCACKEVRGVSKKSVGSTSQTFVQGPVVGKGPHKSLHVTPRKHGLLPKMYLHVITKNAKCRPKCRPSERNIKR